MFKPSAISQKLGSLVGIMLGLACLYWVLKDVNRAALAESFARVEVGSLALVFLIVVIHGLNMALKWKIILGALKPQKFWHCYWSLRLGFFFNAVLPAKLGEAIRVWFVHRKGHISFSAGVGATVADRMMEFFGLVILFYAALLGVGTISEQLPTNWIWLFVVGGFSPLLLMGWLPKQSSSGILNRVFQFLHRARDGMRTISRPKIFLKVLAIVMFGWLMHIAMILILSHSIGISLKPADAIIVMFAVSMAGAIPSAPSNLGTFEFAAVFVLTKIFGASPEDALVLGLLYHFVQLIPTWLIGASGYIYYHSELLPELKRIRN